MSKMTNDTIIAQKPSGCRAKLMDVLWGAWIKQLTYVPESRSINIEGIYEDIYKQSIKDYPFTINLRAVIAYRAFRAESGQTYDVELKLLDVDGSDIISLRSAIDIPEVDYTEQRWYEDYELDNVEIEEPGYYELSICINKEIKKVVPLWVVTPKEYELDENWRTISERWL